MSKLAKAFGTKYEQHKLSMLTRTFDLGDHTFKVRVPSVAEIEKIYDYFRNPNETEVENAYQLLITNIKDIESDEIVKTENDIVVDGRSMREAAKNKVILQYRIVEYFKFLIPETNETLDDLTYADIENDFPLSIQIKIVDKINEAISPEYKEARGK